MSNGRDALGGILIHQTYGSGLSLSSTDPDDPLLNGGLRGDGVNIAIINGVVTFIGVPGSGGSNPPPVTTPGINDQLFFPDGRPIVFADGAPITFFSL